MTKDLQKIINEMQAASNEFYSAASKIGNHAFIEFTGFMNEYISLCQQAANANIDFTEANKHTGKSLKIHPSQAAYIGEKFECIFGGSLKDEEAKKAFCKQVFGGEDDI